MPVLGAGGVLDLRRELPEALLLSPEAVISHANALDVSTDGYWTGDRVLLWGPRGLPFDLNGNEIPDVLGGWGLFFGSRWGLYGPRAARLTSGSRKWFGPEPPFQPPDPGPLVDRIELFVYRDRLDRLSFYRTLQEAYAGDPDRRLRIFPVDFRTLLLAPVGGTGYQARLATTFPAVSAYAFPEGITETALPSVATAPPEPRGLDDDRPWRFLAEMENWTLELTADEANTTGLGEKFSESVRTMISGSGTANFFINCTEYGDEIDSTFLVRLLLLLEKGGEAEAVFNLTKRMGSRTVDQGDRRLPTADTCYTARLLFVVTAVDTRASDIIRGSARFVSIGPIKPLIG